MKKTILDRYAVTDDGKIVIDISVRGIEELYHNFDKTAPYTKKEFDEDFVDYLTDCVREIRRADFIIQFSLESEPDTATKDRVCSSIQNYYIYLKELEKQALKTMFNRFLILFGLGVVLLILAIITTRRFPPGGGVATEVFAGGLTIAAWVSLWEAIALLFLEWQPHRQNIRVFNKVMNAPVCFRVISSNGQKA
jgi:hypothetical protein